MSLSDLQAPASVPEHVVTAVQSQLEFLAPKCGLAVTAAVGREASLVIASVTSAANHDFGEDLVWYRVGNPAHRCAALVMQVSAMARLAELFMGGNGVGEDRVPSPLEAGIVSRRLGSLLTGLDEVLAVFGVTESMVVPVGAMNELNLEPQQVRATIEVRIGQVGIPITLVLPAASHAVRAPVELDTSSVFAEALRDVPVSVDIRFEPVTLTAEELDALEVGDIVRLDQPEHARLVGIVDGQRVFVGQMGRHGKRLAIEIAELAQ